MITIELCGGLGNQLFQIFATIAFAIRQKQSFFFKYTEDLESELFNETVRKTYWNTLLKNLEKYTFIEPQSYIESDTYRINEANVKFNNLNLNENKLFYLTGYFQSYKYFQDEYQEIYNMIEFEQIKNEIVSKHNNLTSMMLNDKNSISMHFRLGDYKSRIDWHPIMEIEYYKKCLDQILNTIKHSGNDINIFYFCEEEDINYVYHVIEEIRSHFYASKWGNFDCIFHHVTSNISDWEQLILMSVCHHNVIANSSFSLWAAYLNSNEDKVVCYPEKWFGILNSSDTTDMFPEKFIKVSLDTK